MKLTRGRKATLAALLATGVFIATGAASCDSGPSASTKEASSRDTSYSALVARQPAHGMSYSPTRDTINGWIDTWNKPGQLSYVYLQGQDGKLLGYFVLKGRPVTMCAALTPTQKVYDGSGSDGGGNLVLNAPSVDGVYYSGGQCNDYYGFTTDGVYVEFTVGQSQNLLLFNQPLPQTPNVPNLAPSK